MDEIHTTKKDKSKMKDREPMYAITYTLQVPSLSQQQHVSASKTWQKLQACTPPTNQA